MFGRRWKKLDCVVEEGREELRFCGRDEMRDAHPVLPFIGVGEGWRRRAVQEARAASMAVIAGPGDFAREIEGATGGNGRGGTREFECHKFREEWLNDSRVLKSSNCF